MKRILYDTGRWTVERWPYKRRYKLEAGENILHKKGKLFPNANFEKYKLFPEFDVRIIFVLMVFYKNFWNILLIFLIC